MTQASTIERLYQRLREASEHHAKTERQRPGNDERPAGAARLEALLRSVDAMTGENSAFEPEL